MEHKHIPVLRSDKNIYWLNIDDICYSSIEGKRITYHTKDECFYQIVNFDELLELLSPEGGFEKLDRAVVIQLRKISSYDAKQGLAYFEEKPHKHSKFATIAGGHIQKLKKLIGLDKDISDKDK